MTTLAIVASLVLFSLSPVEYSVMSSYVHGGTRLTEAASADHVTASEIGHYCEIDGFEARCPNDSVVVMVTARYGRMQLGPCIEEDFANTLGCQKNVLPIADARCSGRPHCHIGIPDRELEQTMPCNRALKNYLEASYTCVKVETPTRPCLSQIIPLSVSTGGSDSSSPEERLTLMSSSTAGLWSISREWGTGYIVSDYFNQFSGASSAANRKASFLEQDASSAAATDGLYAGCATERSPVRVTAGPGQRLNITVYDFSYGYRQQSLQAASGSSGGLATGSGSSSSFSSGAVQAEIDCGYFVVISEPQARRGTVKICPGAMRMRTSVYVSINRTVEIYFKRVSSGPGSSSGGVPFHPTQQHRVHHQHQLQQQQQSLITNDDRRYLVQFTVMGCVDLSPTDDTLPFRISEHEVQVTCLQSNQKWRLTCVDNKWQGTVGNCTSPISMGTYDVEDEIFGQLSHGTAVAVVLCVALLMGVVVLIIGALALLARRCQSGGRTRRTSFTCASDLYRSAAEVAKNGQGTSLHHVIDYGFMDGEHLELGTGFTASSEMSGGESHYVRRVLCTSCGRDFDLAGICSGSATDSSSYAPIGCSRARDSLDQTETVGTDMSALSMRCGTGNRSTCASDRHVSFPGRPKTASEEYYTLTGVTSYQKRQLRHSFKSRSSSKIDNGVSQTYHQQQSTDEDCCSSTKTGNETIRGDSVEGNHSLETTDRTLTSTDWKADALVGRNSALSQTGENLCSQPPTLQQPQLQQPLLLSGRSPLMGTMYDRCQSVYAGVPQMAPPPPLSVQFKQ